MTGALASGRIRFATVVVLLAVTAGWSLAAAPGCCLLAEWKPAETA